MSMETPTSRDRLWTALLRACEFFSESARARRCLRSHLRIVFEHSPSEVQGRGHLTYVFHFRTTGPFICLLIQRPPTGLSTHPCPHGHPPQIPCMALGCQSHCPCLGYSTNTHKQLMFDGLPPRRWFRSWEVILTLELGPFGAVSREQHSGGGAARASVPDIGAYLGRFVI
jgi:hypothetical protein